MKLFGRGGSKASASQGKAPGFEPNGNELKLVERVNKANEGSRMPLLDVEGLFAQEGVAPDRIAPLTNFVLEERRRGIVGGGSERR